MSAAVRHSMGSVQSHRAIVERAEALVRARPADAIHIAALSRFVGISERGLRNAFYTVRGLSPKRSLLTMRLSDVRLALVTSTAAPTTVTQVATQFGFYELGRFAVAYRQAFGEAPSQSLYAHLKSSKFGLSAKERG